MKVISPLFAVALATAVFAPSVDATACSTTASGNPTSLTDSSGLTPSKDITESGSTCTTAATQTGKKYLKSLRISEDNGLGIVVTFKNSGNGGATIPATPVAPVKVSGSTDKNCYVDFADVGKDVTLTGDVVATVTCADANAACAINYEATFACQPKPCANTCSDATCTDVTPIVSGTPYTLNKDDSCPKWSYSYLKSLVVGSKYAGDSVSVKGVTGGDDLVAASDSPAGTCYMKYGAIPSTAVTANTAPIIACAAGTCTAKVKPEWACTDPKCVACTNAEACTEKVQAANAADVVLTGTACTAPAKRYLKSLDVRGKLDKNVVVTFNTDAQPIPASNGTNCYYYTNVANLKADAVDVTATIKCANKAEGCTFEYKEDWGCYTPAAPDTYTRTGATGASCVSDLTDCANRCAKSYAVATLGTDKTFVPQFTTGCKCPSVSAVAATGLNSATTMAATFTAGSPGTMTIAYTAAGKACTSTYANAAFTNSFIEKSYTRTSGPEPSCVPGNGATDAVQCSYKCAAEFGVSKPAAVVDSINATWATVTGCTCGDPTTAVVDGDGLTASSGTAALKYDLVYTSGTKSVAVKTTTTPASGSAVVCNAVYKERCATVCTDAACTTKTYDGTTAVKLTKPDDCPRWKSSYLASLIVGSRVATDAVVVKETAAGSPLDAAADSPANTNCYKKYGKIGIATSATTGNTEPVITCTAGACKVDVKPEWACSAAKCAADCTVSAGCQTPTLDATTKSFTVTKVNNAPSPVCGTTEVAYIKSLEVIGTSSVTFNNDLTPTAVSKGETCAYYTDVINLKPGATDVTATIKCNDPSKADCAPKYNVEWGCYTPPVAANTYTRTTLTGADCVKDVTDCANRCAKSYMLGKQGTDQMFVPQLTGDCTCPRLTATPADVTNAPNGAAANSGTKMNVAYDTSAATMTITYTGKDCTATYTKAAFANKFAAKTYTLATMTPAACATATDCSYKCAGEIVLTNPATITDAVNVTQTAVTGCTCADPIVAVVEGNSNTASGTVKTVKYDFSFTNTTSFKLTTTTPSTTTPPGAATVCEAVYTEKVVTPATTTPAPTPSTTAPTPPATTVKTGTSAGVAATGADAGMVTVALMAAAAGAHAGMPVV